MLRRVLDDDGFAAAVVSCRGWMPWHSSVTISHGPWRPAVDEEGDGDVAVCEGGRGWALRSWGRRGSCERKNDEGSWRVALTQSNVRHPVRFEICCGRSVGLYRIGLSAAVTPSPYGLLFFTTTHTLVI